MLTTPHALVGASIGVASGNPVLGFAGAIVSHYLLDAIPHTDPGTFHYDEPEPIKVTSRDLTMGLVDLGLTLGLLTWLAGAAPIVTWSTLAGIVGAILPDVVAVARFVFPKLYNIDWLRKYYELTKKYHRTSPPSQWILGMITQLTVIVLCLWYLLEL